MTQNTQNKLAAYNQEIQPMLKVLNSFKEDLKEFKATDTKALQLQEVVKESQEALKTYLLDNPTSASILEDIKEHSKEFGLAVKGAAKGSAYKVPELKAYYVARSKEDAVEKAVDKGQLFQELNKELA